MKNETHAAGRFGEIIRFAFTGGACFLIEFALLKLFRDACGIPTLPAEAAAFLISTAVNFMLCLKWVFPEAKEKGAVQKIVFLVSSVIGLGLNLALMALFGRLFGEDQVIFALFGFEVKMYMISKIIATAVVMVWNYFTKRAILVAAERFASPRGGDGEA